MHAVLTQPHSSNTLGSQAEKAQLDCMPKSSAHTMPVNSATCMEFLKHKCNTLKDYIGQSSTQEKFIVHYHCQQECFIISDQMLLRSLSMIPLPKQILCLTKWSLHFAKGSITVSLRSFGLQLATFMTYLPSSCITNGSWAHFIFLILETILVWLCKYLFSWLS